MSEKDNRNDPITGIEWLNLAANEFGEFWLDERRSMPWKELLTEIKRSLKVRADFHCELDAFRRSADASLKS